MNTLEIISLLTILGGLITLINFSLKMLGFYRRIVELEINIKRDVNHSLNNTKQLELNLATVIKQFDNRLDLIEKQIIKIESHLSRL